MDRAIVVRWSDGDQAWVASVVPTELVADLRVGLSADGRTPTLAVDRLMETSFCVEGGR